MSVLIRGMDEIPEDGAVLVVKHDDNGKVYIKYAGVMGYSMEIVKLPEKHGRLIDADELKKEYPKDTDWEYPVNTNQYVCETIDEAKTVLEAEDGT